MLYHLYIDITLAVNKKESTRIEGSRDRLGPPQYLLLVLLGEEGGGSSDETTQKPRSRVTDEHRASPSSDKGYKLFLHKTFIDKQSTLHVDILMLDVNIVIMQVTNCI